MSRRVELPGILFLAVAQLAATACADTSGTAGDPPAGTPPGPMVSDAPERRAGLATLPSGRRFILELAVTPAEQARGYMFRDEIRPDEGMLFIGSRPAVRRFHMKNCRVPIDMIWLDQDFRVLGIEHAAPPCVEEPCPTYGPLVPSHHVLELRGGVAAEEGLETGDVVHIVIDPSAPGP